MKIFFYTSVLAVQSSNFVFGECQKFQCFFVVMGHSDGFIVKENKVLSAPPLTN